jgi:hypothetical protein
VPAPAKTPDSTDVSASAEVPVPAEAQAAPGRSVLPQVPAQANERVDAQEPTPTA